MDIQKNNVMKLCSFYVSDWHLVTMILPYINKNINEKIKISTILENDMRNNVEILLEKLNLKNKDKILEINWNKNKEKNMKKVLEKNMINNSILIVNGSKDYIDEINKYIDCYIEKIKQKEENKINIKIINCYEIVEFNGSIVEILDKHDKILNTSGEKEIKEVFEDYDRKKKIG